MSQFQVLESAGAYAVKRGQTYTSTDLPTFSPSITIDKIIIVEAPRVWRPDYDRTGNQILKDGVPVYVKSKDRGARIIIKRAGATFPTDKPNTPILYLEGREIGLTANTTYTFLDDCVVEFGTKK